MFSTKFIIKAAYTPDNPKGRKGEGDGGEEGKEGIKGKTISVFFSSFLIFPSFQQLICKLLQFFLYQDNSFLHTQMAMLLKQKALPHSDRTVVRNCLLKIP